ncbi:hypothetical protein C4585_00285, partial [Candidatus Parcubacteria bacterium]
METVKNRTRFFFVVCISVCTVAVFFFLLPLHVQGETQEERRVRLQQELAAIEQDIAQKRGVLTEKQAERTSLERDIAVLDHQISIAQQQIRHRDLTISKIRDDIGDKQVAISELDKKVERSTASLGQLIRRTKEIDDISLAELVLSGSLTDFFRDFDDFQTIQASLDVSFEEMALLRTDLSARKNALEGQRSEEEELRHLQLLEKQAIEQKEKEKQQILTVTKGEEKTYQQLIADREKQAAQIRSALFNLRDSAAIPFGTAYQYAKEASAQTGVRPALILAILRQETNLGENVGQCLLTNEPNKGDGKGKNTGRHFTKVMHPNRDVDPFMEISRELGFDPYTQVVSCPQSVGYGGAMGPSQFIPSTWMLYKDRLARIVGESPPNPW